MDLRKYDIKLEVANRSVEHEQWHSDDSQIEILKRGLYSGDEYSDENLSEDAKKLRDDSKRVWTANNTFMWNWDGISDKVKGLAKHRQPNLVTQGIAEQYHALLSPPLTASCGHRCTMARARMANQNDRVMKRLDRYYGTYYGTPGTDYPEGITSENIDKILSLISRDQFDVCDCCRCHNAKAWFGLNAKVGSGGYGYDTTSLNGVAVRNIKATNGFPDTAYLRMDRGEWFQITNGQQYYAHVLDTRKVEGRINREHIGWHAGLMRPRFRYREQHYDQPTEYSGHRPQWYSNIRLADETAVISGLHNPKRFLCPNCFTAAKGLPPHLYWVARGYSNKAAKAKQAQEFEAFTLRSQRWHQGSVFDVKFFDRWLGLYV